MQSFDRGVTFPKGFRAATAKAGLRTLGDHPDVMLLACDQPSIWTATYTTNKVQAAPLLVTRDHVDGSLTGRAAVCNVAYANAATGAQGLEDAQTTARLAAELLGIEPTEVAVASTGVIGQPIPMDKLTTGLKQCPEALAEGEDIDHQAARAIMTTDTRPKTAAVEVDVAGCTVRVGGMAKGSGMIAPNMATMLGFITTDVAIERRLFQGILLDAVESSFNRITVDGHTSTNDMVLGMASGLAGNTPLARGRRGFFEFAEAVEHVCRELALQIVADGEGATRVMEVNVTGAESPEDARAAAFAIANSPLVKCAVHGGDPNWGRILSAAGYSGAAMQPGYAIVKVGKAEVFRRGMPVTGEVVSQAEAHLQGDRVELSVDLGVGTHHFTVWGCDLSKEYVTINADYHT